MVNCPEQGANDWHIIQLMPLAPYLAQLISIMVPSFWYWLTYTVLEKQPFNRCVFLSWLLHSWYLKSTQEP